MGLIAACLLLLMEEEEAFWLMASIVEDLLPACYYSCTLVCYLSLNMHITKIPPRIILILQFTHIQL